MSRPNQPSTNNSGTDRLESLRRAQLAFESLEQGIDVPDFAAKSAVVKKNVSAASNSIDAVVEKPVVVQPKALGLIQSSDETPPAIVIRKSISLVTQSTGSAFEQLKMGQSRLGRNVARVSAAHPGLTHTQAKPAEGTTRALDKDTLIAIEQQTKLKMVAGFIETVGKYYKTSKEELDAEIARLDKMSPTELGRVTMAYEFAANQVLIVTNEDHARKTAMESTKDLRKFYDDNGSTDLQVESDRQENANKAQPPQKKGRMRKG